MCDLISIRSFVEQQQAESILRPLEEVFKTYPRVDVPEEFITKVKNGAILTTAELPSSDRNLQLFILKGEFNSLIRATS